MRIDGSCHCGNITFTAEVDPADVFICHCADCQSLSGSAYRVVVLAPSETFQMNGEPKSYIKTADSGRARIQTFCPDCGSPFYSCDPGEGPKVYGIRLGTVRQRDQLKPRSQYWCQSAQNWTTNLRELPQFESEA